MNKTRSRLASLMLALLLALSITTGALADASIDSNIYSLLPELAQQAADTLYANLMATQSQEEYESVFNAKPVLNALCFYNMSAQRQSDLVAHYLSFAERTGPQIDSAATAANGAGVQIAAPANAFPENTSADVAEVTDQATLSALAEAVAQINEDAACLAAFDISFPYTYLGIDTELQPAADTPVSLTFTVPSEDLPEGAEVISIYHMVENADGSYAAEPVAENVFIDDTAEYQVITVDVGAFSTYYVTTGTSDGNSPLDTTIRTPPEEDSTYYVEPNTQIAFSSGSFTVLNSSEHITLNGRTITIGSDATLGETASFRVTYTRWFTTVTCNLTFVVVDRSDVIEGAISTQPIYLSIKTDEGIPSEPALSGGDYTRITSSYDAASSWGTTFSATATNYIKADILSALIISVDGSSTVGVYDATGRDCLKYIMNIDWDRMMDLAIDENAVASDGVRVTSSNRDLYRVIPYVIKLMTEKGVGWHIDCVVVPNNRVTLSYDLNLKNYVVPNTTLTLPNAETGVYDPNLGKATLTTNIGKITGVNVGSSVQATLNGEEYNLTLLGWSKDPNATAADPDCNPGKSITIEVDTVLYAVWEGKPAKGTLTISKRGLDQHTYAEGDYESAIVTVTGNGKTWNVVLCRENSYTAKLIDLPAGNYTVTEQTGWTWRYSNANAASVTAQVAGGKNTTVTFENKHENQQWLGGDNFEVNDFGTAAN